MRFLALKTPGLLAARDRHLLRCATRIPVPPLFVANTFAGLLLDNGHPAARILPALLIASIFALLGHLSRGVTRSGALTGAAVATLIYIGLGLGGFVTLFAVFAIAWLTTRIGYSRKRKLGLAESSRGRNSGQVLANLAAAAGFATIAIFYRGFEFAAVAALAEAAADTASSEVGEALSGRAWLITNLRAVEPGTNGAVSLPGTITGMAAALLIAYVSVATHAMAPYGFWLVAAAGYLGTVVDSLLGATLERTHRLNNNTVNLLSTLSAGLIALAVLARFANQN
jgi:uncharacterized protein (TIGR00297 family)